MMSNNFNAKEKIAKENWKLGYDQQLDKDYLNLDVGKQGSDCIINGRWV